MFFNQPWKTETQRNTHLGQGTTTPTHDHTHGIGALSQVRLLRICSRVRHLTAYGSRSGVQSMRVGGPSHTGPMSRFSVFIGFHQVPSGTHEIPMDKAGIRKSSDTVCSPGSDDKRSNVHHPLG